MIGKVEISIDAYADRTGTKKKDTGLGNRVAVRHKPHGVLAVLGPYNFPAHLPNGHIVPALLAGNAVVFKPSEKTPASGAMLVECFHQAGVPEGVIRLLIGGPEEGKALASQKDIDGLLFTGSVRGGKALHKQFAETPDKILALELGGNNPMVVWDPKDLHAAAAIVVQSAFLSAGQRCTAARRLIVEDGQCDEFLELLGELIDRIIVDHPFADPQPFMGPVIDDRLGRPCPGAMARPDDEGRKPAAPARPAVRGAALSHPRDDRRDRRQGPPRRRDCSGRCCRSSGSRISTPRSPRPTTPASGSPRACSAARPTNMTASGPRSAPGVINWNKPTNGAPSSAPFGGIGLSGNHRPSAFYAADYCAYPVTSVTADRLAGLITEGLREAAPKMKQEASARGLNILRAPVTRRPQPPTKGRSAAVR